MKTITAAAIIALSTCSLFSSSIMATAQAPDIIIVDGVEESLHTNPLAPYLAVNKDILPRSYTVSSSNWRGYVATWEVAKGQLRLNKVEVDFHKDNAEKGEFPVVAIDVTKKMFPDQNPIVATWYSGALVLPKGELVDYVHMGYGSTYERYTLLIIDHGNVQRRLDLSESEFVEYRDKQFKAYKLTPEYAAKVKESKSQDPGHTDALVEEFLFAFESEHYLSVDFGNVQ